MKKKKKMFPSIFVFGRCYYAINYKYLVIKVLIIKRKEKKKLSAIGVRNFL